MTATVGLRERKNAERRAAITQAACELALQHGLEATTIAQIAERADVSPRTVHAWFRSKEDIVVGAQQLPLERLAAELRGGEGDTLERVWRWMAAEGEQRIDTDELSRLRYQVITSDPQLRALHRARQDDVERLVAESVGRETGHPATALAVRGLASAVATILTELAGRFARGDSPKDSGMPLTAQMLTAALQSLRDQT